MNIYIHSKNNLPQPAGIPPGRQTVAAVLLAAVCWLALPVITVSAAPDAYKEYEVKAVFLFNFAQFVEWPEGAFPDASAPLCVGVMGDDKFAALLEQTVKGETVKGRALAIKRIRDMAEAATCHVLFISRGEESRLPKIFGLLGNAGVLTVGECSGFAIRGGGINFFIQGNKIRFEINPESVRQKGLKISSQLLSLARIIEADSIKGRR